MYSYVGGFGDTAGATDNISNPDPAFADPISSSLLGNFINRVQALYKRH
jgi:hypothetical protein